MEEIKIKSYSYTLWDDNGNWLGQVVLTNDGMFASVTDYGNLSYAWRAYKGDFREFIIGLNVDYFATKLYTGMSYIAYGEKYEKACERFAQKILPPLQKLLREEMKADSVENIDIDSLTEILKSDSVYRLLRYGVKCPSGSGMNECDDDSYSDLYNLVCKLRKQ